MNYIQKTAAILGLTGLAAAYAASGEAMFVQPLPGKPFAKTKLTCQLPGQVGVFNTMDIAENYSGLTDLTRPIVGPLNGRVRLLHGNKPISDLEAGLDVVIPTGKLPAYAETYVTHNGKTGTLGFFGTISKRLATLFGKDLTAGTDICAEAYGRVKPEAYWANASPWLTLGQFKLGYGLTATPDGLSHNVGAGLTF